MKSYSERLHDLGARCEMFWFVQAKGGAYLEMVQTPILPSILESGVLFLFRWALDDSVDAVLIAAVAAIHALLCNTSDQVCMLT